MRPRVGGRIGRLGQPLFALILLLSACRPMVGRSGGIPSATADINLLASTTLTPFQPELNTPLPTVTAFTTLMEFTNTQARTSLWISPAVPESLQTLAVSSGLSRVTDQTSASIRLDVSGSIDASTTWIYALVAPFPTITDDVPLGTIQDGWAGKNPQFFANHPLLMTDSTLAAFSALWGNPADGSVNVVAAGNLVDSAWANQPAWAIIPFEELEPRWKVISVDGQSPIHNDFDPQVYPLKVSFALDPPAFQLPTTNRDPQKLTVLAMTGVTALVRGTADRMEKHGVLYPGEAIRSVLRSADLTHVSNEVSFYNGCPTPDPWTESLQFCSDPRYIALLEDMGVDIVELTGNHELDYGTTAMLTTLDMYDQRGWLHFGGGRNLADASNAVTVTQNGNKLAFLGCNPAGPPSDWATDSRPGSAPCDYGQIQAQISSLKAEGFLPIVTFQYNEYYQPEPTTREQADFRSMAEAGAVIVSGSQSHVPAAMEITGGTFIHYGLGNLFFDQMSYRLDDGSLIYTTRDVFVDRHIFYDGKYLGTELLTFIIEDYARPRPMTDQERSQFLKMIFAAAGW